MPCAQRDRVEQFQVDFMSQGPVQLSHTGGSDVFVSGFKVVAPIVEGDREQDSDDEPFSPTQEEEDDDDEEEEEEVWHAPASHHVLPRSQTARVQQHHCIYALLAE